MGLAMSADVRSPVAIVAGSDRRVVCGERRIPLVMRVSLVALGVSFAWVVPKIAATFEVPWQLTVARITGYAVAVCALAAALLARSRVIAVERGWVIVASVASPLRPGSERRIPHAEIRDVSVHQVRVDDGGPGVARYRYNVTVERHDRRRPVRLLNLSNADEALHVAQRIRDALTASSPWTRTQVVAGG